MNKFSGVIPESLQRTIHELDTVFSQDRKNEMDDFFAEDEMKAIMEQSL